MVYAPASDPFVITVGAVGTNDTATVADDDARPLVEPRLHRRGLRQARALRARPLHGRPARGRLDARQTRSPTASSRSGYAWMSGTSFAAPVVAGAAAQILARHPAWTPDQVKGALMLTARNLPEAEGFSAGVGEIDAAAAAAVVDPPNPNAALNGFVEDDPSDRRSARSTPPPGRTSPPPTRAGSRPRGSRPPGSPRRGSRPRGCRPPGSPPRGCSASWVSASWVSSSNAAASWVSANEVE